MGGYSFEQGMREQLVAICDVDDNTIAKAMKQFQDKQKDKPAPKVFNDYRKMFDECQSEIDVVLIATPDHHHAPAAIRAIHLGKATFSQKPLAHDIHECYALAKAAREKKVLTQMGNQGHCSDTIRKTCEYIWDGHRERDRDPLPPGARLWRPRRPARLEARAGGTSLGRVDRPGALSRIP
jgi:predicted dehydrogenase